MLVGGCAAGGSDCKTSLTSQPIMVHVGVTRGRARGDAVSGRVEEGARGEGREARGGERAAAGQGVGAQRHAGALRSLSLSLAFAFACGWSPS